VAVDSIVASTAAAGDVAADVAADVAMSAGAAAVVGVPAAVVQPRVVVPVTRNTSFLDLHSTKYKPILLTPEARALAPAVVGQLVALRSFAASTTAAFTFPAAMAECVGVGMEPEAALRSAMCDGGLPPILVPSTGNTVETLFSTDLSACNPAPFDSPQWQDTDVFAMSTDKHVPFFHPIRAPPDRVTLLVVKESELPAYCAWWTRVGSPSTVLVVGVLAVGDDAVNHGFGFLRWACVTLMDHFGVEMAWMLDDNAIALAPLPQDGLAFFERYATENNALVVCFAGDALRLQRDAGQTWMEYMKHRVASAATAAGVAAAGVGVGPASGADSSWLCAANALFGEQTVLLRRPEVTSDSHADRPLKHVRFHPMFTAAKEDLAMSAMLHYWYRLAGFADIDDPGFTPAVVRFEGVSVLKGPSRPQGVGKYVPHDAVTRALDQVDVVLADASPPARMSLLALSTPENFEALRQWPPHSHPVAADRMFCQLVYELGLKSDEGRRQHFKGFLLPQPAVQFRDCD
jgi:hypothetical protein